MTARPPITLALPPGRRWRRQAVDRDIAKGGSDPEAARGGQIAAEERGRHAAGGLVNGP
jgi:hypothetical protein